MERLEESESDVEEPEAQQPSIPAVDQAAVLQGFPGVQGQFEGGGFMDRLVAKEQPSDSDDDESVPSVEPEVSAVSVDDEPAAPQPSIPAVDQAVLQGFPGVQGQFEGGEFMERLEESESDVDQSESDVDQSESDVEEPSSAFDLF